MIGDLLMGSTSSATNHQNIGADSYSIKFGEMTTGASMYFDPTANSVSAGPGTGAIRFSSGHNVQVDSGGLYLGTASGGILGDTNATKFFGTTGRADRSLVAGSFYANGTTTNVNSIANPSSQSQWARLYSTVSSVNGIQFRGNDFYIDNYAGENYDVFIGSASNANTNLVLYSSLLHWGNDGNDYIEFNNADTYRFYANASQNISIIEAGSIKVNSEPDFDDVVANTLCANNIVKAWGTINVTSGGTVSVIDGYNIETSLPTALSGIVPVKSTVIINFDIPFENDDYAVIASIISPQLFRYNHFMSVSIQNTTNFWIDRVEYPGATSLGGADWVFSFIVVGQQ